MERILVLLATLSLAHVLPAEDRAFPVVDGDREAVIVGKDVVPRLRNLGYYRGPQHFLQHYVERSTGRKLRVVRERDYDPATVPFAIFVGKSKKGQELFGDRLAKMDKDSYIVHVTPNCVVLIGASDHSTAWAQFDFARRYLGIDVYFPGKCGLVVPKHERVCVPVETRFEEPAFLSRAFSAINTHRTLRGQPDIPWRMYRRYQFHHNIQKFITVKEYGKTNPEYFPWRNGKRVIVSTSAGPGPCIANPNVVRIIIDKCRKYFDENPAVDTISLGMTDGGWCECEACKAMDGPSIEINEDTSPKSQRYYKFLNQVARALRETHPDRYIGVLGYAGAEYPPADLKVERNIIPYMCYTRANWFHEENKQRDLAATDAWIERVDKVGIYEYLYGSGFSVPRIYLHYLAGFLKHVASGAPGSGFYAEIYSNHGLDGPKAWVVEKLLWNPKQDVDELVHRWCVACFREAADPMERYFRGLEETWCTNGPKHGDAFGKFYLYNDDKQLELFTPNDLEPRWSDIDEARELANRDEVKERIEYFASTLKIADLTVRQYHAYKEAKRLWGEGASAPALLAALIEGDRTAPKEDVKAYIDRIQKEDKSKFLGGVEVKAATEIARKVVVDLAWPEVYRQLKAGEREPKKLVAAARKAIASAAPAQLEVDPVASARIDALLKMASRIAVAPRVASPPTIDGEPSEVLWKWIDHHPWFAWKSGVQVPHHTHFALAYDDEYLYVAVRCPQDDLKKMRKCTGYGSPAWKYASIEFFINPDGRDTKLKEQVRGRDQKDSTGLSLFQTIVAYGGGLWERGQNATEEYAATDDETEWRAELKLSFSKMGFSPKQYPYLRVNLVRNVKSGGHSGVAWFPSTGAHAAYDARGWLIFR